MVGSVFAFLDASDFGHFVLVYFLSPAQCDGQPAEVAVHPDKVHHPLEEEAELGGHLL